MVQYVTVGTVHWGAGKRRDRGGGSNEAQNTRVLIRALLKLDLEVGCITVDMLKVRCTDTFIFYVHVRR